MSRVKFDQKYTIALLLSEKKSQQEEVQTNPFYNMKCLIFDIRTPGITCQFYSGYET